MCLTGQWRVVKEVFDAKSPRAFHAGPPPTHTQIIHINLTSESPQPLTSGAQLAFTYSVQWKATSIPFVRRFERYLDFNFFEHQAGAGGEGGCR